MFLGDEEISLGLVVERQVAMWPGKILIEFAARASA